MVPWSHFPISSLPPAFRTRPELLHTLSPLLRGTLLPIFLVQELWLRDAEQLPGMAQQGNRSGRMAREVGRARAGRSFSVFSLSQRKGAPL